MKLAAQFIYKTVSEETRRAYSRVIKEFFLFVGNIHPQDVVPEDGIRFRDKLQKRKLRAVTVAFKLRVISSFYEYLRDGGIVSRNPISRRFVQPPKVPTDPTGRALIPKEVRNLLSGPKRDEPEGARDYAIMLVMLRLSLRVNDLRSIRTSGIKWSHGRWTLRCKIKGGDELTWPLPKDVKAAIDEYLKLDKKRRNLLNCGGEDAYLFQPFKNHRTLEYDRALSARMIWNIIKHWGDFTGVGKVTPHDLRRTAITRAWEQLHDARRVLLMSKHRTVQSLMRYIHSRDNMEENAVNVLDYEEDAA